MSTIQRRHAAAADHFPPPMPVLTLQPPDWTTRAACRDTTTPDVFFPSSRDDLVYLTARRICIECPVATECLDTAIALDDPWGMWGGLTPPERARLRRRGVA